MNKKLDLGTLSLDEMWQVHETIIEVLSVKLTAKKRELEDRLARLARENGMRSNYRTATPKYQNTDAPFETWSGRGKRPRWLSSALASGRALDEFVLLGDKRNNKRAPVKSPRTEQVSASRKRDLHARSRASVRAH